MQSRKEHINKLILSADLVFKNHQLLVEKPGRWLVGRKNGQGEHAPVDTFITKC
jgi:hypothetical protein